MSAPKVRTEQELASRHYLGSETFYVELHREATLTDDLTSVIKADIEHIVIYLGDGAGETRRMDGNHNLRVGITVPMAEWLQSALMTALTEVYRTRREFLTDEVDE